MMFTNGFKSLRIQDNQHSFSEPTEGKKLNKKGIHSSMCELHLSHRIPASISETTDWYIQRDTELFIISYLCHR